MGALALVETGLAARAAAEKYIPGAVPPWIRDLNEQAKTDLFAVVAGYTLEKDGLQYPIQVSRPGFRAASLGIVTTSEVSRPWQYDVEFLTAVKSGAARLVKGSEEVALWPLGSGGSPLRLSAGELSLEVRGNPQEESAVSVPSGATAGHERIKVLRRASPAAFAVLTPQTPAAATGFPAASAEVLAQDSWEKVAVFRLRGGDASKERAVDVLQMTARRDGSSIRLSEPVESAVFGSPILTPEGVIGLVQDEQSGAFLPQPAAPPPATVN
jgi:hypothetical protein